MWLPRLKFGCHAAGDLAFCVLLAAGAEPKQAAVYIAAQQGQTEALQVLLAAGADPKQASNAGVTPVFIAAQGGKNSLDADELLERSLTGAVTGIGAIVAPACELSACITCVNSESVSMPSCARAAHFLLL